MPAIQQQESTTIIGTITGAGNATVTVTKSLMTGSPLSVSVALLQNDTPTQTAAKMATALNSNSNFAAVCHAYSVGAVLYVLVLAAAVQDATLNIAYTNDTCTGLTPDLTSDEATLGDAGGITHGYCTLAEWKQRYLPGATADTARDSDLEDLIEDISRLIDEEVHQKFYVDLSASARYFTPRYKDFCPTDYFSTDTGNLAFSAIVTVKLDLDGDGIYETTLEDNEYWAMPLNSVSKCFIQLTPIARMAMPLVSNSVEVTANWGRLLHGRIHQACMLQVSRIWARRTAPLGVMAVGDMGQATVVNTLDPDVINMLNPFKRVM